MSHKDDAIVTYRIQGANVVAGADGGVVQEVDGSGSGQTRSLPLCNQVLEEYGRKNGELVQ